MGIAVRTGIAVRQATQNGVADGAGNMIPADVIVWTAGVKAAPFLRDIDGLECNRVGQLIVKSTLQTTRDPAVFAIGDCAECPMAPGSAARVAALAQAAHQQAELLARSLPHRLTGTPLLDFRFRDRGTLISIASRNTFGRVFGNRIIEGALARFFYVSLYRVHQAALYGYWRTAWLMLGSFLAQASRPKLKLH